MNHMASRLLKLRGVRLSASAALLSTLFACSGDDTAAPITGDAACATASTSASTSTSTSTSTSSSSKSSSSISSSSSSSSSVADAAADSSAQDAGMDSATQDGSPDATVGPPAPLNLCPKLDALFNLGSAARGTSTDWPNVIVNGDQTTGNTYNNSDGFINLVGTDCNVATFFNDSAAKANDLTNWGNNVELWEQRIFGCPANPTASPDAGISAGFGFPLVPPVDQTNIVTTADLKRLGDLFVEAVIQAVANQVTLPGAPVINGPLLTGDEIDALQQWVDYEETLYPQVQASSNFSNPACPVDAGTDGG